MGDSIWSLVSFIRRSKNRRKVVAALRRSRSPLTPSDIAKKTGIGLPNTGRAVKSLREKGLIECLNPEDRVYRHYALTEQGEAVLEKVREVEESASAEG